MNPVEATPEKPFGRAWTIGFTVIALALGVWFFSSLDDLWPLAKVDLNRDRDRLRQVAGEFLVKQGFDLTGYRDAIRLHVEESTLDFLESNLGREEAQAWIRRSVTLIRFQIFFKKPGEPRMYSVAIHPGGPVLGWTSTWLEEAPGASLDETTARAVARRGVYSALGLNLDELWEPKGVESTDLKARRRHQFQYERVLHREPEVRERLTIVVEGDAVATAVRRLVIPESARLAARSGEAPSEALQWIGFVCLAVAGFAALFVFLTRLQAGKVRLRRVVAVAGLAFVCGLATRFLQDASLFLEWDPLWPRALSLFRSMVFDAAEHIQIFLVLLMVIAAGDALDRETSQPRGKDLWLAVSGRLHLPAVGLACWRGFLLGLVCGGVMTAAVLLLGQVAGATTAIQPRGFFFFALNASHPALATLFFFFGIALMEELGYRFFGGTWLMHLTGKRWLAILVPALIYGLTHTNLDFLPPADPFWARPLVMTLVGCVWGWGFFRFGALAVVISHFTADLFIFNWPRLASGNPTLTFNAAVTILVPLIPALLAAILAFANPKKR